MRNSNSNLRATATKMLCCCVESVDSAQQQLDTSLRVMWNIVVQLAYCDSGGACVGASTILRNISCTVNVLWLHTQILRISFLSKFKICKLLFSENENVAKNQTSYDVIGHLGKIFLTFTQANCLKFWCLGKYLLLIFSSTIFLHCKLENSFKSVQFRVFPLLWFNWSYLLFSSKIILYYFLTFGKTGKYAKKNLFDNTKELWFALYCHLPFLQKIQMN